MGKATTWLRSLLSSSKKFSSSSPATKNNRKSSSSSKWSQLKSCETDHSPTSNVVSMEANKHAIAVAAATAAVAEAAIAAAQAAAEVVRLTNASSNTSVALSCGGGGCGGCNSWERRREIAAIKIQSAFRAYLARRALRALKGFVKLQAIVRGRIVRKQSADMLRRMQALVRIQARACASRAHMSGSSQPFLKSSQFHLAGNTKFSKYQQHPLGSNHCGPTLKKGGTKSRFDVNVRNIGLESSWLDRSMEESTWNHTNAPPHENLGFEDEKNEKILEIDTWKPRTRLQNTQHFMTTKYQNPHPSVSCGEVSSLKSPNLSQLEDQVLLWNSNNTPYGQSSSSTRNPFTPTRSECNGSFFGEHVGYPNYMTCTESSMAKVRSQSVPRHRMLPEKVVVGGDGQRMLSDMIVGGDGRGRVYGGNWDVETSSEKGFSMHTKLMSKARSSSVHKYRLKT